MRISDASQLDTLDFERIGGLLPVIAQHARTGEVLMLGFADREALRRTLDDGRVWFYSRSRQAYWRKGETSGNELSVVALHRDCDADAVLALVEPAGPTCHTGARSCFGAPPLLLALDDLITDRATHPEPTPARLAATRSSYTRRLLGDANLRLKKLGEESIELALACAASDRHRTAEEAADLLYHTFVACAGAGVRLDDVLRVLAERRSPGGSGSSS